MKSALALLLLAATLPASTVRAQDWSLQPGSVLGFATTFEGVRFAGTFRRFTARIAFDPGQPRSCTLDATITLASADTGNADRDRMLPTADFFDVARFPTATYRGADCTPAGPGRYSAQGTLTLRGVSKPVPLTLQWRTQGAGALLTVDANVPRLAFGVGSGQWADPGAIGLDVAVHGALKLAPAK